MVEIGLQRLLIWVAVLAALGIMIWGVASLNHISERLSRIEASGAGIQDELHILSGDTANIMPNRGSLLDIEKRMDAIESKLP